jgi:hypothetical protein
LVALAAHCSAAAARDVVGMTTNRALLLGHLWVALPAWVIGAGLSARIISYRIVFLDIARAQNLAVANLLAAANLLIFVLVVGAPVCLWCFIMAPKWRLWAMSRVDDWPTLKKRAILTGLLWPDWNLFKR